MPAEEPSFSWGMLGGIAGAMIGAIVYVAFIEATHIRIGYLAIAVAYLVAKGVMMGSRAKGGLEYQITAVALTTLAVSLGNSVILYLSLSKQQHVDLTITNIISLLAYGIEEPFLRFATSGPRAVIGLIILFVGLRAAWRMTSSDPNAVRHPFSR